VYIVSQEKIMLTADHVQALCRPFPLDEHEFRPEGFAYITEAAIASRLDEVDPNWALTVKELRDRSASATPTVTVVVALTVCGVTRDGVGSSAVEVGRDGRRETNEAEKAAATDALRRAARLFGIGRYLLNAPRVQNPADRTAFARWLASLVGDPVPALPKVLPGIATTNPKQAKEPWTRSEQASWYTKHTGEGLNGQDLLKALGVSRLSEFTGTLQDAEERLKRYIEEQTGIEAEQQAFDFAKAREIEF
jgi:hypothetical protein